jgi:group I intron endonuclease
MNRNDAGIYSIVNLTNGKVYVGSAVSMRRRWQEHRRMLTKGIHPNKHLQRAWKKNGQSAFDFRVLEVVAELGRLIEREQAWIDSTRCYVRRRGYNLSPTASSTLGFKFSEQQRRNVSAGLAGKQKSESHKRAIWQNREATDEFRQQMAANGRKSKGRRQSEEHRQKRALAQTGGKNHRAKLTDEQVVEILRDLANGVRGRQIAQKYGVHEVVISEIKHGKKWKHILRIVRKGG